MTRPGSHNTLEGRSDPMGLLPCCHEEAVKEKEGERLRLPGRLLMAGNHVIGWDTTAPGVTVLSFMTSSLGWVPAQCLVPGINTSWQQPSPCVFLPHIPAHRPAGQLLHSKESMEISIPALPAYCLSPSGRAQSLTQTQLPTLLAKPGTLDLSAQTCQVCRVT